MRLTRTLKLIAVSLPTVHATAHASVDDSGKPTASLYAVAEVIPGLGHAFHGQYLEGGGYFAANTTLLVSASDAQNAGDKAKAELFGTAWFNTEMYGIYDAYKDGGEFKGTFSKINVGENFLASFDARYMTKAAVYIPIALHSLILFSQPLDPEPADKRLPRQVFGQTYGNRAVGTSVATGALAGQFAFVGWGEEAFFRGFVQHELSRALTPYAGIPLAATLFGLAHTQYNGSGRLAVGLEGLYMGLVTHSNDYDLREMIFYHTLRDVMIGVRYWLEGKPVTVNLQLPTFRF